MNKKTLRWVVKVLLFLLISKDVYKDHSYYKLTEEGKEILNELK